MLKHSAYGKGKQSCLQILEGLRICLSLAGTECLKTGYMRSLRFSLFILERGVGIIMFPLLFQNKAGLQEARAACCSLCCQVVCSEDCAHKTISRSRQFPHWWWTGWTAAGLWILPREDAIHAHLNLQEMWRLVFSAAFFCIMYHRTCFGANRGCEY